MITENGFLGLVPKEAVIGDEVCILFRGDVPYILRPTAEDKGIPTCGATGMSTVSWMGR
jgi:hypothetical protein